MLLTRRIREVRLAPVPQPHVALGPDVRPFARSFYPTAPHRALHVAGRRHDRLAIREP